MGRLAPNYYLHDAVVPRSQLPAIMRQVMEIARRHGIRVANVFHAGDGNLHPLIAYNASIPGETDRAMPWIFSEADLEAQRRAKTVFDPEDRMNPFKVCPTPVSCGELLTGRPPRLAASGLWI